jgi:pyrimidine-nucleoside phosphorylase
MLQEVIDDGSALDKLAEFVKAQGGDPTYVYEPEKFKLADICEEILSPEEGYIQKIVCDEIGICSLILGGGRETKESEIDLTVGIVFEKKIGAKVTTDDTIAVLHANDKDKLALAVARLQNAITIGQTPVTPVPHILGVVEQS